MREVKLRCDTVQESEGQSTKTKNKNKNQRENEMPRCKAEMCDVQPRCVMRG